MCSERRQVLHYGKHSSSRGVTKEKTPGWGCRTQSALHPGGPTHENTETRAMRSSKSLNDLVHCGGPVIGTEATPNDKSIPFLYCCGGQPLARAWVGPWWRTRTFTLLNREVSLASGWRTAKGPSLFVVSSFPGRGSYLKFFGQGVKVPATWCFPKVAIVIKVWILQGIITSQIRLAMNSYNLPAVGEVRTQVKSLFLFFDSKIFTLTFIFQKTSINAAVSSFVTPTNLECFPQWTACLLLGGG